MNALADCAASRAHSALLPLLEPLQRYARERFAALEWQARALAAARAIMRGYLAWLRGADRRAGEAPPLTE